MLRLVVGVIACAASISIADAATTKPNWTPFCQRQEDLSEYVKAIEKFDRKWAAAVPRCFVLKGGLKIEVISAGDVSPEGFHVDKVRIFVPSGSMVGYAFQIDER